MMHRPITIQSIGLSFPQKTCFTNFSTQIHFGSRIGVIGQNGSGKTTLLKMIQGLVDPSEGRISCPDDVLMGYVPQVIEDFETLSGGQRLNHALTEALSLKPNVLLLDEPTNHLDRKNRASLMRLLQKFPGTILVISHDAELLRTCVDTLWDINLNGISVFKGNYDDYLNEVACKRASIEDELSHLNRQKKEAHHSLMKEQTRARNSRRQGEKNIKQRKWPTIVSDAKARRAEETSGTKKKAIYDKRSDLINELSMLRLPERIVPKFSLQASDLNPTKMILSVKEGTCGYDDGPLLKGIFLSLKACDRLAINGENGAGKSTLVRGILNDSAVIKTGEWMVPNREDIGYLDQHYATLNPEKSVLETIQDLVPEWSHGEIRRHLNDFLFRNNEEVMALVSTLSGGEKARLSLAQIAAKTPKILILDEMTNNLDLETQAYVIQVLQSYPGAIIIISHDIHFMKEIGIEETYDIGGGKKNR